MPLQVSKLEGICDGSDGAVRLHTMPHVGHWLHVEDVRGMIQLLQTHSSCLQPQAKQK